MRFFFLFLLSKTERDKAAFLFLFLFLGSKETYEKFILIRSKIVENQETAIKA
jgi:hypothetical protein